MTNLKFEFMRNFVEISNTNSIYARCLNYDIFTEKKLDCDKLVSWQEEVDFLISMANYWVPKTRKRILLELYDSLLERYNNCIKLNFTKYEKLKNIFKKEIDKFNTGKINANKVIIAAKKIYISIQEDKNLVNFVQNEKELFVVYEKIEMILKINKEIRASKKLKSSLDSIFIQLKNHLVNYEYFLNNKLQKLLEKINDDKIIYTEMCRYTIPNIFESKMINPFYMYLTFKDIDNRTKYRIEVKKEYNLFWVQYKEFLIITKEISRQNNKTEKPTKGFIYSDLITPELLIKIIKEINDKGIKPTPAIQSITENHPHESYVRKWIKANSKHYSKFKGKTYKEILEIATKQDIIEWYKKLSILDVRFKNNLE